MFEIGWTELLVIAVVALVVFPTKDLPRLFRTVGQWVGKARRMAGDFQTQFNSALREAEREADLLDTQESLKQLNPVTDIKAALNPVRAIGDEIKRQVTAPIPPTQALKAPPPGAVAVPNTPPMVAKPAVPETPDEDGSILDDLAGLIDGGDAGEVADPAPAKPAEPPRAPVTAEAPKTPVPSEPSKPAAVVPVAPVPPVAAEPAKSADTQEPSKVAAEVAKPADGVVAQPKRKPPVKKAAVEDAPVDEKPKRVRKPKADGSDKKTPGGEA